jgi:ADP-heptose:LPS heptosyltransferase
VKILVVRFSSIGDIVLTFPVVRCIKEQVIDSEVHYLTKPNFETLLTACEFTDKTHFLSKDLKEMVRLLKQEQFDIVIDLHNNLRTHLLTFQLGVKCYRFPKLNFQKWFLTQFKINCLPEKHVVDRYFETVATLGVINDGKNNQFYIPSSEIVDCRTTYDLAPKSYLAVAIGAQFATKRIPESKLLEILSQVSLPIVLLGGKEDFSKAERICQKLSNQSINNACGKHSLLESASIVSQTKVLLTNDTGLMHIAACFAVPIVSVWGNTVPELGMYAYKPEKEVKISQFEVPNLTCRPCSKIGFQACPKKHFDCMLKQDAGKIVEEIESTTS